MTPNSQKILTQARLKELLYYDPDTGIFTWRVRRSAQAHAGTLAGSKHHTGYLHIQVDGKIYQSHRLAVLYMTGIWPEDQVDHKNGCRSDNQWDNLRSVTRSENCHNQSVSHSGSSSDFIGVHFDKRRGLWAAQIRLRRVSKWLGYHPTAEAAHAAYLKAKDELHPTHLRLREAA